LRVACYMILACYHVLRIILTPIPDPLWLALHGPKFAEISLEDVERVSEEMQEELTGEGTP
jgi:hypothetical protein